MTNRLISVLVVMAVLISVPVSIGAGSEDVKEKIIRITDDFLTGKMGRGGIAGNLNQLLDAAVTLTQGSQYHDKIEYRVEVAQQLFVEDSIFNEKARQYLSFAYRMVTGGVKYQKPPELDVYVTPEEANQKGQEYCRGLVKNALTSLDKGDKMEAARCLLEFVLLIVTPMTG